MNPVVPDTGGTTASPERYYRLRCQAVLPVHPSGTTALASFYTSFSSFNSIFLFHGLVPSSSLPSPRAFTGSGAGQKRATTRPRAQHLQFGYTFEEDIEEEELVPTKTKSRTRST